MSVDIVFLHFEQILIERYSNRLSKSSSVLFNFDKSFRLSNNLDQIEEFISLFDIDLFSFCKKKTFFR